MYVPHVMARLGALAVVAIALSVRPARADELTDQAKRDVAAGLAAQNAGHYDEAIALYKKAFDEVPHPEILFDLGQAFRLKGDAEIALGYYRRYVAVEPNGRAARDARHWVAELRKQLADKKRDGQPAGAGQPPAAATTATPAPGVGSASAPAGGSAPAGASAAKPAPGSPVAAPTGSAPAISTAPAADRGDAALMAPAVRPAAAVRSTAPGPAASSDHHMTYTWIAAGAGGASLIGGLVSGALARSKRNAATEICGSDRQCDSAGDLARANKLLAQSRTRGTVSTVLVITGVAGLVTSAALWWTGRRDEAPRTAVAPVVSPDAVGLAFGTVF